MIWGAFTNLQVAMSSPGYDYSSPTGKDQPDAVLPTFLARVAPDLRDRP
ncbi:MAG: hypothetical protein AAGD09_23990 [Cyanobacteria bacterium P01_F01_bin.56]